MRSGRLFITIKRRLTKLETRGNQNTAHKRKLRLRVTQLKSYSFIKSIIKINFILFSSFLYDKKNILNK